MNRLSQIPLAADDWAKQNINLAVLEDDDDEKETEMPFRTVDITGQTFNQLTAIRDTGERTKNRSAIWLFRCSCGAEVTRDKNNVKFGSIKHCGGAAHKTERKARTYTRTKPARQPAENHAQSNGQPKVEITVVANQPPMLADFRLELIETGKDITTLIRFARKLDPRKVKSFLDEIERVASSPFAQIPEGAREEAAAAQEFISKLEAI